MKSVSRFAFRVSSFHVSAKPVAKMSEPTAVAVGSAPSQLTHCMPVAVLTAAVKRAHPFPTRERFRQSPLFQRGPVIALAGTRAAQRFAIAQHFTVKINSFAALRAHNPLAFVARKVLGADVHLHIGKVE